MSHEVETQRRYAVLKQLQGVPPDMQSQYLNVLALAKHADLLEQKLRAVEADMQYRTNWLDAAMRGLWTPLEIAVAQSPLAAFVSSASRPSRSSHVRRPVSQLPT